MSLTINQAANDLLSKLGIEVYANASTLALQDVVTAINGAMQLLQTAGEDYFTRDITTISVNAGTSYFVLNQGIQSIIGPLLLDNLIPLRELESQGEVDQFDRIYQGSSNYGANTGTPFAYFAKYIYNGQTAGDISGIELWLCPVPTSNHTVKLEVVLDAVPYAVSDLNPGTALLPVAQNYAESILLPIARLLVTRSSQFSRPDLLQQLTADGEVAMKRLGLSGGAPPEDPQLPARKSQG